MNQQKQLDILCDACKKVFSLETKPFGEYDIVVNDVSYKEGVMTCPHCLYKTHLYFLNQDLLHRRDLMNQIRKKPGQFDRYSRLRKKYAQLYDNLQALMYVRTNTKKGGAALFSDPEGESEIPN